MPWSFESRVHRAGDLVPAGTYERIDGAVARRVVLSQPGRLPPSFDGHVALYRPLPSGPDPLAGRRTLVVARPGAALSRRQPS